MNGNVRAYVASVAAVSIGITAVAAAATGLPTAGEMPALLGFGLAMLLVQLLPVPFPRGSQLELVRVEEAVVLPLLLLLDPVPALLAVAAGVGAGHALSRAEPIKAAFNVAQLVCAVGAALLTTWLIAGSTSPGYGALPLVAAGAGLLTMLVVNQLLVAGVMRVASATPLRAVLFDDLLLKVGMWCANAALGTLLVLPAVEEPALLLVALVPLAMLHGAWRVHAERAREEQNLRELGVAVGDFAHDVSPERVARQIAEAARELVGASRSEVRLHGAGRAFWSRRTSEGVQSGDSPCSPTDSDAPPACSVPLVGAEGAIGELCVWHDPAEVRVRTLDRRDRTMLAMLGHQAATTLDNAELTARSALQQRTITQVFDHSSEGMLVLDRRGRVRGWNPAMREMSGFAPATVDASPISLLSPQLASIVESDTAGTLDAVISTADGERRHVRASYAPIKDAPDVSADSAGSEPSWVVVLRDMTLEQEAERLKDDFVATVSHELRTPLTAIKGFLETMRREDIDLGAAQVRMFLQIMGEQADRLERLIGDLLDMSAIESGRPLRVKVMPVDLSGTVAGAIASFQAGRPDATVELEGAAAGLVVQADAERLEQVIANLLDNARKHGGMDKPIHVRVEADSAGVATIAVTDHGPGISVADQRRIFDRFFVTADSITRAGGGAGLGLYICRKLVAAMDGEIAVRSHVGDGSTFIVSLPVVASALPGTAIHAPLEIGEATLEG